jgi:hypothetical protein
MNPPELTFLGTAFFFALGFAADLFLAIPKYSLRMKLPNWSQAAELFYAATLISAMTNWGDREPDHVIQVNRLRKLAQFCSRRRVLPQVAP